LVHRRGVSLPSEIPWHFKLTIPGWTSEDGREFVAIGQQDGAAFAEITKEGKLSYLGRLPQYSTPSTWREIRGQNNLMIIGSEAVGHGIQIFDMKKLLTVDPAKPVTSRDFLSDEPTTWSLTRRPTSSMR
jgi:hypothetical protein